jgi:hypothetical protein
VQSTSTFVVSRRAFPTPSVQGWLDASGLARASAAFAPAGCEPSRATGAPPPS